MASLQQNSEPITEDEYLSQMHREELYVYASTRLSAENLSHLEDESERYAIFKHHRAIAWWGPSHPQLSFDWVAFSVALRLKYEQNYLAAMQAFEALFLKHPLFLDLQYHLCDCLESLEAEESIISMLKHECQEFCAQHPELAQTKITDKIPAINKHTKDYFNV